MVGSEYVAFVEGKLGKLKVGFIVSDCSCIIKPMYLIKCRSCIKIYMGIFETWWCKPQWWIRGQVWVGLAGVEGLEVFNMWW